MDGLRQQGRELMGERREDFESVLFCGRVTGTWCKELPDQDKLKGRRVPSSEGREPPSILVQGQGLLGTQEILKESDISGRAEGIL